MPTPAFDQQSVLRFARYELRPQQRQLLAGEQPIAIGGPTFDLLHCLARHRGEILSADLLRRSVWRDRKVADNNLRVQITLLRKLLGESTVAHHRTKGYRFTLAVEVAGQAQVAAPRTALGNVPAWQAPLVGRSVDLQRLSEGMAQHSRVTLIGTAGVGKTALAVAAAAAAAEGGRAVPRDGVWWVELAALTEASQLAPAIAEACKATQGSSPRADLVDLLAASELLLVLDNCEHVLDAVAGLADALLRAAPGVRILLTSRRAVKCAGEQLIRLAPLSIAATPGLAAARDSGAAALFEARARRADPRFALTADNADTVLEICRHLGGIPLAITLAASRVPLLGTSRLLAHLRSGLDMLSNSADEGDERHHSLQATLDWSHGLLKPSEQTLLRRLGVFAGSFGLDSVRAVVRANSSGEAQLLNDVHALIDHCLLQTESSALHGDAAPRYTFHEAIRQYARSRLQENEESEEIARRHAEHVLALARGPVQSRGLEDPRQASLPEADLDNLRAAQAWALEGDFALALELAVAANGFLRRRGHHQEGSRTIARLLRDTRATQHPALVAQLHLGTCAFTSELNELDAMASHVDSALLLLESIGDPGLLGHAWSWAGVMRHLRGEHDAGEIAWHRAIEYHRQAGQHRELAITLNNIGWHQAHTGRHDTARATLEEALHLHRTHESRWGAAVALENLGELAYLQRQYAAAEDHWTEALEEFRSLSHAYHEAHVLRYLAQVLCRREEFEEARVTLSVSLRAAIPQRFASLIADAWCVLAGLPQILSEPGRSAALLHAAELLRAGQTAVDTLERDMPEIRAAAFADLTETALRTARLHGGAWARAARAGDLAGLIALRLA